MPFFSSKALGDVLIDVAQQNPTVEFLALCGHTHGEALYQPLDNLIIRAGQAEYSQPQIQDVLAIA